MSLPRPAPLALVLLLALLLAPPALGQGRIVFEDTSHGFGNIEEGTKAEHVFTFRNAGNAPLRLRDVRPSCGCTSPRWTEAAVAPGETGTIVVVYDSEKRPGPFKRTVEVISDAEPAQVTLLIHGDVRPQRLTDGVAQGNAFFDAVVARLEAIPVGENARHTFRLQNQGTRPLKIKDVRASARNVYFEFPTRPIFAGDVVEINVVVATEELAADHAFDYELVLDTDDEAQPAKALRVQGRTKGASGTN